MDIKNCPIYSTFVLDNVYEIDDNEDSKKEHEMYGFEAKHIADTQAIELAQREPNRFVVMPHRVNPAGLPLTWGVGRYVPYCPQMPEMFDGFVWFQGVL